MKVVFSPAERMLAGLVSGLSSPADVPGECWQPLVDLSLGQGLAGMLLWSLRQVGWAGAHDLRWQPLVEWARQSGRRSLLLEKTHKLATAALDQAQIPAIWLKGAALAPTIYPEPHLRPMDDLDVLVPASRLPEARAALLASGFRPAEIDFFELGGFTDAGRHHECLLDRSGQVKLDLHFRLLVPSLYYQMEAGGLDWFWTHSMDLAEDGLPFQVLKPEANLLHLCAHTILQKHGNRLDLLHMMDLHLMVTCHPLDWSLVVEQAVLLRWTYAVEAAIGLLPALFGTPLPEGVLRELQTRRLPIESLPAGINPCGSTPRWDEWRSAYRRMSRFQRMRLMWVTLFPPETFLRRQYSLPPGRPLLPYYLYHFLGGSREVARALRGKFSDPQRTNVPGEDLP